MIRSLRAQACCASPRLQYHDHPWHVDASCPSLQLTAGLIGKSVPLFLTIPVGLRLYITSSISANIASGVRQRTGRALFGIDTWPAVAPATRGLQHLLNRAAHCVARNSLEAGQRPSSQNKLKPCSMGYPCCCRPVRVRRSQAAEGGMPGRTFRLVSGHRTTPRRELASGSPRENRPSDSSSVALRRSYISLQREVLAFQASGFTVVDCRPRHGSAASAGGTQLGSACTDLQPGRRACGETLVPRMGAVIRLMAPRHPQLRRGSASHWRHGHKRRALTKLVSHCLVGAGRLPVLRQADLRAGARHTALPNIYDCGFINGIRAGAEGAGAALGSGGAAAHPRESREEGRLLPINDSAVPQHGQCRLTNRAT